MLHAAEIDPTSFNSDDGGTVIPFICYERIHGLGCACSELPDVVSREAVGFRV